MLLNRSPKSEVELDSTTRTPKVMTVVSDVSQHIPKMSLSMRKLTHTESISPSLVANLSVWRLPLMDSSLPTSERISETAASVPAVSLCVLAVSECVFAASR
jgi:hypothetical protein